MTIINFPDDGFLRPNSYLKVEEVTRFAFGDKYHTEMFYIDKNSIHQPYDGSKNAFSTYEKLKEYIEFLKNFKDKPSLWDDHIF